jgi:hypothetical protein
MQKNLKIMLQGAVPVLLPWKIEFRERLKQTISAIPFL